MQKLCAALLGLVLGVFLSVAPLAEATTTTTSTSTTTTTLAPTARIPSTMLDLPDCDGAKALQFDLTTRKFGCVTVVTVTTTSTSSSTTTTT